MISSPHTTWGATETGESAGSALGIRDAVYRFQRMHQADGQTENGKLG
jgi:hypothetical protein